MAVEDIATLPVAKILKPTAHLYLWVPNALLPDGLEVLAAWGFDYKTMIIWHKLRKDGRSDGRGVGFYFRNVTETLLFGVRGKNARTLAPGRTQVNYIGTRKREHSRKPDEQYQLIEACSPGPFLEMFGRGVRPNWSAWGNQADERYEPTWKTYPHNSATERRLSDGDKSLQFAFMLPKQRWTTRRSSGSNASAAKTRSSSIGSTTCFSTQALIGQLADRSSPSSARAPADALGVKQELEKTLARNGKRTT